MESNELRIFQAVAQAGSVTKAAQNLGYVQSNITNRIQHLEAELKTQLFYRQHGMILTPAGEKLLSYAEKILHLFDEAQKALDDSVEPAGRLAIGTNHIISSLDLPGILSQYHETYPKVDLSLTTDNTSELILKVLQFQLDCAFVKSSSLNDPNIKEELIYEEELVLIAGPEQDNIETVLLKPFLMNTKGCANRLQLETWVKSQGIYNMRVMEFNNLNSIIEGVIAGLGVSFVPLSAILNYENKGLLKAITVPALYNLTKTFLIRHKDCLLTNALDKFIELITQETEYRPASGL
ncbi:MAG: LysR family transcriptional regulator [Firmicutes bacterium]|nr:LysR family transcriptional regulator [Bacillota bacterium]